MGGGGEKMAFINPLASTAIMLLSYAPRTPDEIVSATTEAQAAEEFRRLVVAREREERQFEVISNGLRSNTITLAPVRYAVDPLENKPRSKRGQRGRRWR